MVPGCSNRAESIAQFVTQYTRGAVGDRRGHRGDHRRSYSAQPSARLVLAAGLTETAAAVDIPSMTSQRKCNHGLHAPVATVLLGRVGAQPAAAGRAGILNLEVWAASDSPTCIGGCRAARGRCRLGGQRHQPRFTRQRWFVRRADPVRSGRSWPEPTLYLAGDRQYQCGTSAAGPGSRADHRSLITVAASRGHSTPTKSSTKESAFGDRQVSPAVGAFPRDGASACWGTRRNTFNRAISGVSGIPIGELTAEPP